jgi:hypothetical protein
VIRRPTWSGPKPQRELLTPAEIAELRRAQRSGLGADNGQLGRLLDHVELLHEVERLRLRRVADDAEQAPVSGRAAEGPGVLGGRS